MSRRTKVTLFVAVVLGLVLGSALGSSAAHYAGGFMHQGEDMAADSQLERFSAFQVSYADVAQARNAVLLEIETLSQLQQTRNDWDHSRSLTSAYDRLAMLENRSGNRGAEVQALSRARYWHDFAHPHEEVTDDQLENGVRRMDELLYHVR